MINVGANYDWSSHTPSLVVKLPTWPWLASGPGQRSFKMRAVFRTRTCPIPTGARELLRGRRVQGLEVDVVLAKQALVESKALQQLPLGQLTAPPPTRGNGGWQALHSSPKAGGTWGFSIALGFPPSA